jgi:hypothetical protein
MPVDLAQVIPPLVRATCLAKLPVAKLIRRYRCIPSTWNAFGIRFKCIDLPTLIRIKEAAGRRKDQEAIAELRVLLEEIEKKQA